MQSGNLWESLTLMLWKYSTNTMILPSYKVSDIATAVCDKCVQKLIGARDSEKMHEILITKDESKRTIKNNKYYIISPEKPIWNLNDYCKANNAKLIENSFEYCSGSNDNWMTIEDIQIQLANL